MPLLTILTQSTPGSGPDRSKGTRLHESQLNNIEVIMNRTTHTSMGACHSHTGGSVSTPLPPTPPVDRCMSVSGSEGPTL